MARIENKPSQNDKPAGRPSILKIMQGILAGAFGVQSERHRHQDFNSSSPLPYIIGGILFLVIFVVSVALIVRWVLATQT
ncbi:DUF2970 domain-containing protein [Marinobacter halodurans]|uniref:DUF2970 domain-containing protein n=1 Tax=Marinobacter halodurans TaxID=2528979 RepID=A0ABY1ZLZ9_9GAMM|nr:DUF2970 domain-containing protein [Marinobacter halodurans]TBW54782.1 DUF2970 domain-containing protein [Marinobacter halodurans]